MNNFKIKNAEYVEIPLGASPKQTNYFPDLPNLRNKPIEGIEVYSVLEQSIANSGNAVTSVGNLEPASLFLYFDGGTYINVPLLSLRRIDNGSAHAVFGDIPNLAGQNIVWTKSYVQINTTSLGGYANKSFLFNVYYVR